MAAAGIAIFSSDSDLDTAVKLRAILLAGERSVFKEQLLDVIVSNADELLGRGETQ